MVVPVLAASAVLLARSPAGADEPRCSTAALRGEYAVSGTGQFLTYAFRVVQTLTFDGAGHVEGIGTAVLDRPPVLPVPYLVKDGTYELQPDCRGTMHWFTNHPTLPVVDHYHNADFVIGDSGREISLIYTNTEFPNHAPEPVESLLLTGRHA